MNKLFYRNTAVSWSSTSSTANEVKNIPIASASKSHSRRNSNKTSSNSLLHDTLSSGSSMSSCGSYKLVLLTQPESQHRARYQTEGSRGAVKDKSGQGYPSVKVCS